MRAVGRMLSNLGDEVQNFTFSYPIDLFQFSVKLGITGHYDTGRLWHAGTVKTKTPIYSVMSRFQLTVADRQTDRRHACSILATCVA